VKIKQEQLDSLLELQELLLENGKLELDAVRIKDELLNDSIRSQMLLISQELNERRTAHEELERDLRRLSDELALILKRVELDQGRLRSTAVPREAIALQHELDTLDKRKTSLQEQISGLKTELADSSTSQHQMQVQRDQLEVAADQERERAKLELSDLKETHQANRTRIGLIEQSVDADLLDYFKRRFARGVAIGRLRVSACGACNMNLNAAAMSVIHGVAKDELASCPECQAILIR
jgi:predicted  nucleic acid-binding Zn-ribbon protein